jgi:hypothetical protein
MRTSSASQLEFDYSGTVTNAKGEGVVPQANSEEREASSATFEARDLGSYRGAYAIASRMAGRLNAATISDEDYEALLKERQDLLDKKFDKTISRQEEIRLEYVRWSLDRIEDARQGHVLDALEGAISEYENFLLDIRSLQEDLQQHLKRKRK